MSQQLAVSPNDFRTALRVELRRHFRWPYEAPSIVVFNAVLVCLGWFVLPAGARDWLFSLHGRLAFPIVLESWMLADVPATNVAGSDPERARAALADGAALRQYLAVKRTGFWLLAAPMCAAIALGVGASDHTFVSGLSAAIVLLVMPFGVLAISAWLGLFFPYHIRPLRWRWERRRDRRATVRWLVLMIVPYSLVPAITGVLLFPSVMVARVQTHGHAHAHSLASHAGRLSGRGFAGGALIACVVSVIALVAGRAVASRIAAHRRDALDAYLADPERG